MGALLSTTPAPATLEDLLQLPEELQAELLGGELVYKASPTIRHGVAQHGLSGYLHPFGLRGGGPTGGWWIATEVEVAYGPADVYRHDIAGWRRERMPQLSRERPMRLCPDWACEVLSPSTARRDRFIKYRVLHAARVGHYWLVDPEDETLTVYRWQPEGYLVVLVAGPEELVRAEPFGAIEIPVGSLFGRDLPDLG